MTEETIGPLGHKIRYHICYDYYPRFGKTSVKIKCPWCGSVVVAYVWSLAGSGKRCDTCPDVVHHTGISAKQPGKSLN